ncbi:MAG: TIGR00366 family protein [Candidatus Acidiferrales bacterium]|jgi:short-chain fatty acids transporter
MRRSENSSSAGSATGGLARLGVALADWSERWFPDAFVFALVALIIVFAAGMAVGTATRDLVRYFGEGFWSLIPFTMQMAIIIVGGYVVATSPPVHRLIRRLARIPRTPRGAVAFVAFFSMATSLVSWGLSLIFSGLLVREVVKNVRDADYRAIGAAAYLGTGTVWALGISSSAALLMATPASIPAALLKVSGVIPLSRTIYTWQSLTTAGILMLASVVVAYLSAPATPSRTAESFGITENPPPAKSDERRTPAEWLEHVPVLSAAVGVLGLVYLGQVVAARGPLAALDLNTYNLLFLMVGLLLHWRPRSFTRAVNDAVPATAGVLIQFPFYGGIFGIVTMSPMSRELAGFFVRISSQHSFPVLVAIYSGILGLFVPSGGSKWIIEAPYVLQAAKDVHVNLGWVVQIYNTAEALPNLVNPFWMLPLLGILKARARDLVGYGFLYFVVNSALVLFLVWFFAHTLPYVPPAFPGDALNPC